MNVREGIGILRGRVFQTMLAARRLLPREPISAFGAGENRIEHILTINLDRQPGRWRKVKQELDRFKSFDGRPLSQLAERMPAIDARDGRETAPTADVDPIYTMRDQLFVQPDPRLEECFGLDERIRMTRQEIAVARSHIEAWKRIARGPHENVLILEDDVYFVAGAGRLIDRGWRAALNRDARSAPELLYLSYLDAGGTAQKSDVSAELFRPIRGFWYLSGYVLSRTGAERLLRSMPVVGPVDLWINHRFRELEVLALSRPALLQRPDGGSDNAYSILPYLSRSGTVDSGSAPVQKSPVNIGPVFAWNATGSTDVAGMALSMLGLRVRTFPRDSDSLNPVPLNLDNGLFDAFVDVPLTESTLIELRAREPKAKFVFLTSPGTDDDLSAGLRRHSPPDRTTCVSTTTEAENPWLPLCGLLDLPIPNHAFPKGVSEKVGLFQVSDAAQEVEHGTATPQAFDQSPWVLPQRSQWRPRRINRDLTTQAPRGESFVNANLASSSSAFRTLTETFPGNLATFDPTGVQYGSEGATLVLRKGSGGIRPLCSGALASKDHFLYGRFEATLKPARGSGLVTGFFLHRDLPRQEIDVEILGSDPTKMLVNVYFNPGDDGAAIGYGYRGTPYLVDLEFDASIDFHTYTIEWTPGAIRWLVDDHLVHERSNWDPTPIPHLPMSLHANLWSPRSVELAGRLEDTTLPALSTFKRITVYELDSLNK